MRFSIENFFSKSDCQTSKIKKKRKKKQEKNPSLGYLTGFGIRFGSVLIHSSCVKLKKDNLILYAPLDIVEKINRKLVSV